MYGLIANLLAGSFGGLVRDLISKKGLIALPKIANGELDLGFIGMLIIGAFTGGFIAPVFIAMVGISVPAGVASYVMAGIFGYLGVDAIENLASLFIKKPT